MLNKTFWVSTIAVVLTALIVLLILPKPNTEQFDLLIVNANTYSDGEIHPQTDIGISNGIIQQVSPNISGSATTTIDAQGKTLIPGLTDAHTHTFGDGLKQALKFGITNQIDMFTAPSILSNAIKQRLDINNTQNADLFSSGMLATSSRGHGTQYGIDIETLSNPEEATAWVSKRKIEGSDFIKLVYMPHMLHSQNMNSLNKATAAAVIDASHNAGLKAVAHISSQRGAQDMLNAGIDGLVHQFADSEVTDAFLQQAVKQNIFVIPTLSVIGSADHQEFSLSLAKNNLVNKHLNSMQQQQLSSRFHSDKLPGFNYQLAALNTKKMHAAGVTILAGSDAPNPGTVFGASLHQELQLLVDAGLSQSQALNAATSLPNSIFGITKRGHIKTGQRANILILNSSPLDNIENTLDIHTIIKNGVIFNRDAKYEPNATQPAAIKDGQLSDFSNSLTNNNGMRWVKTDDAIRNGKSTVDINLDDNTLYVNANVRSGFVFPWADAGLFTETPLDISQYSQLSFRVRGTKGQYTALAFSEDRTNLPAMQNFKVDERWRTVQLNITDFDSFDASSTNGFALVAANKVGQFEYYIDDVKLH